MNEENGQGQKKFLIVFTSKNILHLNQYNDQDVANMFLGATAEFPIARDMKRVFGEFLRHCPLGDYMVIQLRNETPVLVVRIKEKERAEEDEAGDEQKK